VFNSQIANIANCIFPGIRFCFPREKQAVFLTFDDGPHPDTTPRILELLDKHDAKATFFCLGRNVEKYPAVYDSIIAAGHSTGNHTWSHPNGWTTSTRKYLEDADRASKVIDSSLFRPPYGRITPGQWRQLRKKYEIIMWTRMFADYRRSFNPDKINPDSPAPGDILVLHDSVKTVKKTLPILEILFEKMEEKFYKNLGY